jgi:hypothetical protein
MKAGMYLKGLKSTAKISTSGLQVIVTIPWSKLRARLSVRKRVAVGATRGKKS